MTPGDYLIALRRRWLDVVLAVAVALGAAWLITTTVAPPQPDVTSYRATAVLVRTSDAAVPGVANLKALATLTRVGEVPERAAEALGSDLQPHLLADTIEVVADDDTGILRVSSESTDRAEAAAVANAFAGEIISFLREQITLGRSGDAQQLDERLSEMETEIRRLDRQIGADGVAPGVAVAERDALVRQYSALYEQYRQLVLASGADPGVQIVQDAFPQPVAESGFRVPTSTTARMIIAGILGLLSGIVIVLVLDRFDNRIRTRKHAEEAFKAPVIAEIPFLGRRRRKALRLAPITHPRSPTADAFRLLSTMVSVVPPSGNGHHDGNGRAAADPVTPAGPPQVILVTSPGPSDGKTTVVANLAVSLTERGKRVLILSCDFRRPRIHRIFGVGNERGLARALEEPPGEGSVLTGHVHPTNADGVTLVPSGPPPERPGELLASTPMRSVIQDARGLADVVLIDSAPLLTTSDSTTLVEDADAVVLVARAGRTTAPLSERTAEILERIGTPVAGVALNAATELVTPRRYYYYRYATRADRGVRGFPRLPRLARKA